MSNDNGTGVKKVHKLITRFGRGLTTPLFTALALVLAVPAFAQVPGREKEPPKSFSLNDNSQERVDRKVLPKLDTLRLMAEDLARDKNPKHPGPIRFAVSTRVSYTLNNAGTWQTLSDGRLWRLRIQSPGAKNLSLAITRFEIPDGVKLWVYDSAHKTAEGPYSARNRNQRGSLWTPTIEGEEIVVEIFVPGGVAQPVIEISRVNQGYRGLGKTGLFGGNEGTCENDVVCALGDPWRNQIRAVAVYTINNDFGMGGCTGTLLNDVPGDGRAFFLSANHCLENNGDPATVVLVWNFQSATCGTHGPGSLADQQTGGATLRANNAASDFLLFELNSIPDPSFNVFHAGWDATGNLPPSTVGIHHPAVDVKAISTSNTAPRPADWTGTGDGGVLDAAGNHLRIDWTSGVTEGGSSGSCIFETTNGRCIGQLHGGPSSCTATAANLHDYYGMLSVSWTGGGTDATRLSNWLDPGNTGIVAIDGDPHITTANGEHYDFQGAGEFVSLRDPDGLEIQVRQGPVATTFNPGADPHDGIAVGVSLNTAVAARVGNHRVTYEPNLSGVPDPSGLQLRVDGVLMTPGPLGIDLGGGGRIVRTSAPSGLEIDFPDGRVLLVTPSWWASQSRWYLNVDLAPLRAMNGTSSPGKRRFPQGGIAGVIPQGSWLPALPDGSSMGPMPQALHQRYLDLYQRFGEAWRVTDSTSLFDYGPGTSTATFTMRNWPSENGPWVVPGMTPVTPTTDAVARQACRAVRDVNAHRNCVFDVRVTGNIGFATTYVLTQQVLTGSANPPTPTSQAGRLAAYLDLGAGIPSGTFSSAYNTGISFNAGLEYMIGSHVSAEGIFGYHHFPGPSATHANLYQFSVNAKVYLTSPPSRIRPFLNGGVGVYKFSPGSSDVGANVGGGVLYEITPRLGLQGSYSFHSVNTPGFATRFSTVQGGVRLVL